MYDMVPPCITKFFQTHPKHFSIYLQHRTVPVLVNKFFTDGGFW